MAGAAAAAGATQELRKSMAVGAPEVGRVFAAWKGDVPCF